MNVSILIGSRNPEGQTGSAAAALARGLTAGGAKVRQTFLPTRSIERCRQCDANGWGLCLAEGRCVIEDDFAALVDELRMADLAVFATPVYWGDLSESLRAFLDRLRRICWNQAGKTDLAGMKAVGLCVAGGGGGGAANCCVSLERTLLHAGLDVFDLLPVRRQNLALKLPVLEETGRQLATTE